MELDIKYVFDDSESRIVGLRHKRLSREECALFVYEYSAMPKFWMKGVNYNLHLSAIVDGECVESHPMKARSMDIHPIASKTYLVVESRIEIPVGAKVDIVGDKLVVE